MSLFPKIQSPCPYKGKLSDIVDGDICRLCDREVHDITDLSSRDRRALVAGCSGEICVSYRLVAKSALAAAALGASLGSPAFAQSDTPAPTEAADGDFCLEGDVIIVAAGGLKAPDAVEWLAVDLDDARPAMPVVYEDDDEPAAPQQARPGDEQSPARDAPPPLMVKRPAAS
ncbi:hypothetical protein [Sphingopyxis sp. KK2]|uniref:hypothetical protein n=1 Tax=Sphingopyxis sp. KK2 TaxID=1855727 RepID=UPI00097E5EA3|nr:hypothetical protein [Sphingopyxis sp. KK2]